MALRPQAFARLASLTDWVFVFVSALLRCLLLQDTSVVAVATSTHSHTHSYTHVIPFYNMKGSGQKPLLAPDIAPDQVLASLAWTGKGEYYYTDVASRVENIVSPSCHSEIAYHTGEWNEEADFFKSSTSANTSSTDINVETSPTSPAKITVLRLPAAEAITRFWQQIPPPTQMRTDLAMCNDTWFNKKSIFDDRSHVKNSKKICKEVLPKGAPRCQPRYLEAMCSLSMADTESIAVNHFHLPESNHMSSFMPPEPYLIRIRNARVAVCGEVSLTCGTLAPVTLCDSAKLRIFAKIFDEKCSAAAVAAVNPSPFVATSLPAAATVAGSSRSGAISECALDTPYGSTLHHYDRLFVVTQPDDSHIYHVQLEVLPKIAYHLEFLLQNPDIKILIGCDLSKKMKRESRRKSIRFQKKNVVATEVYVPSEGACQDPVHNTWQLLTMRHMVLSRLDLSSGVHSFAPSPYWGSDAMTDPSMKSSSTASVAAADDDHEGNGNPHGHKKPVMLLIKRSKRSTSTRQRKDGFRQWSDKFTSDIIVLLKETFPQYHVKLYSDMNIKLMDSISKQIALFHQAAVVIGVHGAGLGHMLYMKPNSVVVEIAPSENDGRLHLGGGPFNRLSTLLAHNYLVHYPEKSELVFKDREIEFDIQRLVMHVKSFITSLAL